MAKQLWFRRAVAATTHRGTNDAALDATTNGWRPLAFSESRPTSGTTQGTSATTVNGPTNGIETAFTAGTPPYVEWLTEPLAADYTISGTITLNLWAFETSMNDNAAINARIEKMDGATGALTVIATTARTTEVAVTTPAVNNFTVTPTSTACKRGDRIRVRIFFDDAGTMAAPGPAVFRMDGITASADGDSWIQFTENLTFETTAPTGTKYYLRDVTQDFGQTTSETSMTYAGTYENVDRAASPAWTNLGNLGAADSTYATVTNAGAGSDYVVARNFGFSLPAGAYVTGMTIEWWAGVDGAASRNIKYCLQDDNGNLFGEMQTQGVPVGGGGVGAGSNGQLFKTGLTKAIVESANFGVRIWTDDAASFTLSLDYIRMKIYYSTVPNVLKASQYRGSSGWIARALIEGSVSGYRNPVQMKSLNGVLQEWYTPGLAAFTFGGMAKFNLRAYQSVASANASLKAEIAVCNNDGSSPVVWGSANVEPVSTSGNFGELPTSSAARIAWVAGDDVAVTGGQRLRFRVYIDDCSDSAMVAGTSPPNGNVNYVTLEYDGPTDAAAYDTYVILPQTVAENAIPNQTHARFRNDDGDEVSATWKAAIDTNASVNVGTQFRLRLAFEMPDAGVPGGWNLPPLQYSKDGGAWTSVGDVASGADVAMALTSNFADNDLAYQRLTTGVWGVGYCREAISNTNITPIYALTCYEVEYSIVCNTAATYQFRLALGSVGAPSATYTVVPQATASTGPGPKAITPATIVAGATVSGAVVAKRAVLPATIAATSSLAGSIGVRRKITPATIAATSTVAGSVSRARPLAIATIAATSTVSGSVRTLRKVAPATIAATSTVSGNVTAKHLITPTTAIAATSSLSGAVVARRKITPATIAATSTLAGDTVEKRRLVFGTIAATSTVAGAITKQSGQVRQISGTIAASSTVSGNIGVRRPVVPATITGTSTLAGSIIVRRAVLPATIAGTSTLSGSVRVLRRVAPATITATSTMAGLVAKVFRVQPSTIAAVSTVSGSLIVRRAVLPANITATSTVAGTVGRARPIVGGAIAATSTVSGSLLVRRGVLPTTIAGTSTLSGVVKLLRPILPTTITATSTVAGRVAKVFRVVTGTIAATSTVSGSIRVGRGVVGAVITGTSTLAGAVRSLRRVTPATIQGQGTLSGSLTRKFRVLPATIQATSTLNGTFTTQPIKIIVPQTIGATSTLSGSVRALRKVTPATITATSILAGSIRIARSIPTGTITGTSALSGTLTIGPKKLVTGTIAGTTTLTGSIRVRRGVLPANITATSTLSGSVRALRRITTSQITATSTLSGSIRVARRLTIGNITATSSLYGNVGRGIRIYPTSILATSTLAATVTVTGLPVGGITIPIMLDVYQEPAILLSVSPSNGSTPPVPGTAPDQPRLTGVS